MNRSSMGRVVSADDGGTPGVEATQGVPVLARVVALKEAISDEKRTAATCHKAAAPMLAQVIDAFSKDDHAAAVINKSPQKISDYKSGARGLAAYELIAMCVESVDAWHALRSQIDAYHEAREIKPAEAVEILLTVASLNPAVMAQAQQIAALRHGAEPEELLRAIRMLAAPRIGPQRVTHEEHVAKSAAAK